MGMESGVWMDQKALRGSSGLGNHVLRATRVRKVRYDCPMAAINEECLYGVRVIIQPH